MTVPLTGCAPSSQSASCGEVRADLEERPPEVNEGVPAKPARGWDQAVFRCGQCGIKRSAATEDDYLKAVGATRDAYAVGDRLHPIERDGIASILRTVLSAPDLAVELLALADGGL
ncbi:hypothetical protein OG379_40870 (plasmid) [Streptomyces sp. NBC_01166]|uniref:hypothetical protein n=1 Tax=Streptomyces sp. NBC_01166 TaxID=2903755 RepID=UPI002F9128FC|nr:hypothetical protein OG379_40870 [Streptomyces sp. NBC_01166]